MKIVNDCNDTCHDKLILYTLIKLKIQDIFTPSCFAYSYNKNDDILAKFVTESLYFL